MIWRALAGATLLGVDDALEVVGHGDGVNLAGRHTLGDLQVGHGVHAQTDFAGLDAGATRQHPRDRLQIRAMPERFVMRSSVMDAKCYATRLGGVGGTGWPA